MCRFAPVLNSSLQSPDERGVCGYGGSGWRRPTFGAVWGALAFTVLLPLAEMLGGTLPFPEVFSSEHRGFLIFFPILCVFLVFEPLGLLGIWLRVKRYFAAWPFRY